MVNIKSIKARQIIDSRGNPTIEVDVKTKSGFGRAAVPSGASTGVHEAHELRDEKKRKYNGKSVHKAVKNIAKIQRKIKGMNVENQTEIDNAMNELDGTPNKSKLGANTILGVSMAVARANATANNKALYQVIKDLYGTKKIRLPIPFANIINGGEHAGNDLMFQEFMIAPIKAKTFSEATRIICETYHALKTVIASKYGKQATAVGDEGGFAPPISTAEEALDLINEGLLKAGHKGKVAIAMDPAASEFYDEKSNTYKTGKISQMKASELLEYYERLVDNYNIISIEDAFHEDHFDAWQKMMRKLGSKIQIVGDDLTVTNTKRIKTAIDRKLCNALLLKVNQVGSVTESLQAAKLAEDSGWNVMVSHRSGETEDVFISDLVVGLGTGQIKIGAPARGERTSKYNQLLRLEEYLGRVSLASFKR